MSENYKIYDKEKAYLPAGKAGFVMLTVVSWLVPIVIGITRKNHKLKIVETSWVIHECR